jgi:hypothetical protein
LCSDPKPLYAALRRGCRPRADMKKGIDTKQHGDRKK